jgi:phosphoglycolate phosphatase
VIHMSKVQKSYPFAVFFDMDGTLLRTENVGVPAFKETVVRLKQSGLYDGNQLSDSEIKNVFGMTIDQVWENLLPEASCEARDKAREFMLEEEIKRFCAGEGELYPGVLDTLGKLSELGIPLFVVSNGQEAYIQSVCENEKLLAYFADLYSAGRFQTKSKSHLVAKLMVDYQIQHAVMVGDRLSDIEAGQVNHLFTIGCDFGFADPSELKGADARVAGFEEIIPLVLAYRNSVS